MAIIVVTLVLLAVFGTRTLRLGLVAFVAVVSIVIIVSMALLPAPQGELPPKNQIPPNMPPLVGHEKELNELAERHEQARSDGMRRGPVIILIHGMPGTGKTALAKELANRLAAQYPDGQFLAQMGKSSDRRDPGEIVTKLLQSIRGSSRGISSATFIGDPIGAFRSVTMNKRMLFVFDAARDDQQVSEALPSGSGCAVIVTSRQNLEPALGLSSYWLDIPEGVEAAAILCAHLSGEKTPPADLVAAVTEYCERVPAALRAAGEKVGYEGLSRAVATWRSVREKPEWLDILEMRQHVAAEFDGLRKEEQRALALLTLVRTRTFLPWVLQPLMDTNTEGAYAERAVSLVTRLSSSGLVDPMPPDRMGVSAGSQESAYFARYRINPLVRVFMQDKMDKMVPRGERKVILERLHRTSALMVAEVLSELGDIERPSISWQPSPHWLPDIPQWQRRVAKDPDSWVRWELETLVEVVHEAHAMGAHEVCWGVAAKLRGCGISETDVSRMKRAFELAHRSAQEVRRPEASVRVMLAHGLFLSAIEDYDNAFDLLGSAYELAEKTRLPLWQAKAHYAIGQAWQRLGCHEAAEEELTYAQQAARKAGDQQLIRSIAVQMAENAALTRPKQWSTDIAAEFGATPDSDQPLDDLLIYAASSARADDWERTDQWLANAVAKSRDDAGRHARTCCEIAALRLSEAAARGDGWKDHVAVARVHVGQAVFAYQRCGNRVGELRARILLADALAVEDDWEECKEQLKKARALLPSSDEPYFPALNAELRRIEGEQARHKGPPGASISLLEQAAREFDRQGAFWSAARARLALGRARLASGEETGGMADLYTALAAFESCGDRPFIAQARAAIAGNGP
ncbi:NB-ARC domain-containing protein [Actinoallomurus soli]|uniref:NB-ARC domain-containing protein n=1 Tax=Actinoallomurus soli TaxID=2952535 RepID=UPI002093B549|nr:AAA family ATPase [Actinoallomurus soli]MCO5967006.1 AAA family ATPase [Actinoallomurus soli]